MITLTPTRAFTLFASLALLVACGKESPPPLAEIVLPEVNAIVTSPLEIRGSAHKSWFTDGSLPIELVDYNGYTITQGIATVTDETKDADFPDFTASLEFETGVQDAEIVVRKSAAAEEEDVPEIRLRVQFFEFVPPEVEVESPLADDLVESPLAIIGRARGFWFFEGSLPVQLVDADGNVLAEGVAEAKDEWQTEEMVDFEATLEYETGAENGELVIRKDNPSGEPENDAEFRVPVKFRE